MIPLKKRKNKKIREKNGYVFIVKKNKKTSLFVNILKISE